MHVCYHTCTCVSPLEKCWKLWEMHSKDVFQFPPSPEANLSFFHTQEESCLPCWREKACFWKMQPGMYGCTRPIPLHETCKGYFLSALGNSFFSDAILYLPCMTISKCSLSRLNISSPFGQGVSHGIDLLSPFSHSCSFVSPSPSHVHSFYIGEITLALEHLHTNGIIYRYLVCSCTCMQTA